ncbi:restriction endonuclease subunit S [Vreelandella venusta]|uniref:Restriction endonuclease subunit S n=1 Tax=Halomonas hydrothermalis TaxID=115561 RepID=A0A6F8UA59_9GAMM|nr:restriction endonuclease subunit S [Halomonas hydrothermalis]BCB09805.1 restriction endonuclease subunit S [Halomonas hydrothermalis]
MSQRKLPPEWCNAKLGDVVPYGKTQKCVLSDVSDSTWVLELEDVEKESSRILARKTAAERPFKSTKNIFYKGNVLYGKLRPYLNKVVLADEQGVCTTEIIPLDAEPFVLNRYLFYWLKTHDFLSYVNEVSYGVNMPRLGTKDGISAPMILAPLAEQKVIADKLDTLLAQVDNTKARLERIPEILKRFRQSVLAAAVSGRLTEEWRGTPSCSFGKPPLTIGPEKEEAPDSWRWEKLTDLAILESGHTPRKSKPEYWKNGDVPWISLQDIRKAHGKVITKTKFMPNMEGIKNSSARLLPAGTVCFSRDISVGYTTVMGREMATTQHFVNWICGERINNIYLMYSFMAAKNHLTISGQGSTVKTIYMPACKQFRLLTPPLEEQTEIVRRVDQLFAHADRIEQQVNQALARVNTLTQSILAKAFRGELTEQWRKDNPELTSGENSAEALLERIKAERAAKAPAKRTRKKATT